MAVKYFLYPRLKAIFSNTQPFAIYVCCMPSSLDVQATHTLGVTTNDHVTQFSHAKSLLKMNAADGILAIPDSGTSNCMHHCTYVLNTRNKLESCI